MRQSFHNFDGFYMQEIIVGPTIHAVQPLTFEELLAVGFWARQLAY